MSRLTVPHSGPELIERAASAVEQRDFRVQRVECEDGVWFADVEAEGFVLTVVNRGFGWVMPRFRHTEPPIGQRVADVLNTLRLLMEGRQ